ncbi:IS3 family transposase, partial [Paenibacillus lactis]|uniref:IS3 family transposase n=1 Tax=Paenibacillus lactis TaxID=228574 RepID=UPI00369396F4
LNKYETRAEAKKSIFEYIEVFYNNQRIHSSIHRPNSNICTPVGRRRKKSVSTILTEVQRTYLSLP